jgi:hypothetical protein
VATYFPPPLQVQAVGVNTGMADRDNTPKPKRETSASSIVIQTAQQALNLLKKATLNVPEESENLHREFRMLTLLHCLTNEINGKYSTVVTSEGLPDVAGNKDPAMSPLQAATNLLVRQDEIVTTAFLSNSESMPRSSKGIVATIAIEHVASLDTKPGHKGPLSFFSSLNPRKEHNPFSGFCQLWPKGVSQWEKIKGDRWYGFQLG